MILYFADRLLNIVGTASTKLPKGFVIVSDEKAEDVDSGVSSFECKIKYDKRNRAKLEAMTEVGNYLLRSNKGENEFYTIIDAEIDTKKQTVYIYAEDAGLDLLNDIAEAYEADKEYPIVNYIDRFASGAGWEIGVNELEGIVKKLSWDNEETSSARLLKIAKAFNDCEISFSFDIDGLKLKKKYINIYEERGKNTDIQLRLNKEIDNIVITKTITNLATALKAKGSTPADAKDPVTLLNYEYDDGDFYVDGDVLKSRNALLRWSRRLWEDEESQQTGGHIVKSFSYDTTSQAVLCEKAVEELKKICDMEVNYEAEIKKLPDNVRVGDRVNIIDDNGELYLSTRLLALKYSEVDQERKAVLGENFLKGSGISQKVADLATQFAINAHSAQKALEVANSAKDTADSALEEAEKATGAVQDAVDAAGDAKDAADQATESANDAAGKADAATEAVGKVQQSVAGLQNTIDNANQAAQNAQAAAGTALTKAEEAKTAAGNAQKKAEEAAAANSTAQQKAAQALEKAEEATTTAGIAKADALKAAAIANAAKKDADQAEAEIAEWESNLKTVTDTMSAEYSRKTDLTEATESLQSQISRNAGSIKQNVIGITMIDETANNALTTIEAAQKAATLAQQQANEASAIADEAQIAANTAADAAEEAQNQADIAQAAYETAKQVADKAEADLKAAEEDLATVADRVDATEEEIATAQKAVDDAQTAADTAKANAKVALATATAAKETANEAIDTATRVQAIADKALNEADIAQELADQARDDATAAENKVKQAYDIATTAKATADSLKKDAEAAQATADQAALDAIAAQQIADDAQAKATKAANDLATAEQKLADVLADVDATEEAVINAYAYVDIAQAAVNEAQSFANQAQISANTALNEATQAQAAADTAKAAADTAQDEAKEAQDEVDKALGLVYSLEKRVTTAETGIEQTKSEIRLFARKSEVAKTLGNYYTKIDTEAAIELKSNEIKNSVSETHLSKKDFDSEKSELTQKYSEVLQKADSLDIKFTQKTSETDNEISTKLSEIYKNFGFTPNGLIIGGGKNALTLSLDNDNGVMFSKNGQPFGLWDGEDFYTGNIVIAVNKRAQFGNFAFVPRTTGALSFLKIKGANSSNVEHSHDYRSSETVRATCTEPGVMGYICGGCGESYTATIPALGHNYEVTSTGQGYTTYTCTRCGDSYTEQTSCTHASTDIKYETTKEATCTSEGSMNRITYCTSCNAVISSVPETIPKLSHTDSNGDGTCDICSTQMKCVATFDAEGENSTDRFYISSGINGTGTNYGTSGLFDKLKTFYFYAEAGAGRVITGLKLGSKTYTIEELTTPGETGQSMLNESHTILNYQHFVFTTDSIVATVYFDVASSGSDILSDGDTITEGVETYVEIPSSQTYVYLKFEPKHSGSYTFESLDQEDNDPDCIILAEDKSTEYADDLNTGGFSATFDEFDAGNTYYLAVRLWAGTGNLKVKVSYNGSSDGSSYVVTLNADPSNGGTVSGGGNYSAGGSATIRAEANSGYTFAGWYEYGSLINEYATTTISVNGNRTLTAKFTDNSSGGGEVTVTIDENFTNFGSVQVWQNGVEVTTTSSIKRYTFNIGDTVKIQANSNSGYSFAYWRDMDDQSEISTENPYTFTVTSSTPTRIRALFT